jgi:hypothetical protein
MNVGIVLSFFNQRYFRDSLSTWCDNPPVCSTLSPTLRPQRLLAAESSASTAWQT